jgi:hypothetical protein
MAKPRMVAGSAHLDAALATNRDAYRESTWLLGLLSVTHEPASPAEMVDRTLRALSELFWADVACVVRRVGSRLVVTHAYGTSVGGTWPVGPAALDALARGRGVARSPVEPTDLPPPLEAVPIRSAAWVPMSARAEPAHHDMAREESLLVLLRRGGAFTPTEAQVLHSAVNRLRATLTDPGGAIR